MSRYRNHWAAGLLSLVAVGCGGPYRHTVEGIVRLDGLPLGDAAVLFEPVAGGPAGYGVTDAAGRFSLQSANRRGVVAGDYRVAVSKHRVSGIRADETIEPGGVKVTWIAPERFSTPATSGLTITVPSDRYEVELISGR